MTLSIYKLAYFSVQNILCNCSSTVHMSLQHELLCISVSTPVAADIVEQHLLCQHNSTDPGFRCLYCGICTGVIQSYLG